MLLEAIARHVRETPEHPAYQNRTQTLTYGELWHSACALAFRLRAGAGPVLVCGEKEAGMPVCFLACLMAGRPWLPVDPQQPVERLLKIRRQAGSADVLCCGSHPAVAALKAVQAEPLFGGHELLEPERFAKERERDAYWMFTSGSAGAPKGVRIPLSALENFVEWMLSLPAVAACGAGVNVNQARFSFDLSVADLWPTFAAGGTVRALEPEEQGDLPALYKALGCSGARRLVCTPSFARLCLCDAAFCRDLLPDLETVLFCGETLAPHTVKTLGKRFPGLRILNAYGPTEATCAVSAAEVQGREGTLPVGWVDGAASRLIIMNEQGEPQPDGEPGEIVICGHSVGSGYIGGETGGFLARLTEKKHTAPGTRALSGTAFCGTLAGGTARSNTKAIASSRERWKPPSSPGTRRGLRRCCLFGRAVKCEALSPRWSGEKNLWPLKNVQPVCGVFYRSICCPDAGVRWSACR